MNAFLRKIQPRQLFLLDSLGALLTAFLLGVVLVEFESLFGMPRQVLHPLSLMACVFALYSFICFLRFGKNWRLLLTIIAVGNLIYCCFSIGLVLFHFRQLSVLGLAYFIIEVLIIMVLANVELQAARRV